MYDFLMTPSYFETVIEVSIFMNKSNSPYILKHVYNKRVYWKCVIRKVDIGFCYKPSGLKYDQYCQGYIDYSSRRHKQKITPGREKVLTLQKPVRILKKKIRILILDKF